jgi:hypothetical protein
MLEILSILISLGSLFFLWRCFRELQVISGEERRKDELNDALEKFGRIVLGADKKKRVSAFKAGETDGDN